jgi:AmmeMemoRadiSam system protein B
MQERPSAVAGMFYERDPQRLREQVQGCLAANQLPRQKQSFLSAVVPHAGLMYSGHVAAALYGAVRWPRRLIFLGPNHTGLGADVAINLDGAWRTPLGSLPVDKDLAAELSRQSLLFQDDKLAHAGEHSLEVQLPFVQMLAPDSTFVPICIRRPKFEVCEEVGEAIAKSVQSHEDFGIVASSDLNHYQDQKTTLTKDQRAIDAILALDPRRLWDVVREEDISMCGILPTTAMLVAARSLGAKSATLLKHATSGDINGDYHAVVGYAAILIA